MAIIPGNERSTYSGNKYIQFGLRDPLFNPLAGFLPCPIFRFADSSGVDPFFNIRAHRQTVLYSHPLLSFSRTMRTALQPS